MAVFISFIFKEQITQVVNLRLLFTGGNSQPHGHGQVVGDASQLGDETELLDFLKEKKKKKKKNQINKI